MRAGDRLKEYRNMSQNARKAAPAKPVYRNLTPDILQYIDCVERTLDAVFNVPADRRKQIVTSLRREHGKSYWDVTLHYLPLYSAAELAGVSVEYPEFGAYEEKYSRLIERRPQATSETAAD